MVRVFVCQPHVARSMSLGVVEGGDWGDWEMSGLGWTLVKSVKCQPQHSILSQHAVTNKPSNKYNCET